jgi:simple sugar transport system permease protein
MADPPEFDAAPASGPGSMPSTPQEALREQRLPLGRRIWELTALPMAAVLLAFIVGALVIAASSIAIKGYFDPFLPLVAYAALLEGGLGIGSDNPINALTGSIVNAAPLLLAGLSVALGFKAGLFNIGATGQFVIGGLAACIVGAMVANQPPVIAIPIAVFAGAAAGAFYGFIPGVLKAFTGAHEVVTTIMLNYIATYTATALVIGPFRAPGFTFDRTADIGNAALPVVFGRDLNLGVFIALAFVPIIGWLIWRTTIGFEIRTVGANPSAARYAGMSPRRLIVLTMSLCGMLAGLAGTILFLGEIGFYPATFGTAIGFDAIAIALLGRAHPVGVLLGSLLFGVMRAGAPLMQIRAEVPLEIIDVLQAIILFFLAADIIVRRLFRFRAARAGVQELSTVSRTYGEQAVR